MMNKIKKVVVDDSKKTTKNNEAIVMKGMASNREFFELELPSVTLSGHGAYKAVSLMGEERLMAFLDQMLTSEHLKARYDLAEKSSIHDLMDATPLYSAIRIELSILEEGWRDEYYLVLIKECEETKNELSSFRVPAFQYRGREWY